MKVIEILMQEHQTILRKLSQLELVCNDEGLMSVDAYIPYFDFIDVYADQFHHAKEEDLLFKWMIESSPQIEFGPIAVMLKEHDLGRALIKSAKIELLSPLPDFDLIQHKLQMFISLMRDHINKEDKVLYQIAEQINETAQDGDERMLSKFTLIESEFATQLNNLKI